MVRGLLGSSSPAARAAGTGHCTAVRAGGVCHQRGHGGHQVQVQHVPQPWCRESVTDLSATYDLPHVDLVSQVHCVALAEGSVWLVQWGKRMEWRTAGAGADLPGQGQWDIRRGQHTTGAGVGPPSGVSGVNRGGSTQLELGWAPRSGVSGTASRLTAEGL